MQGIETTNSLTTYTAGTGAVKESGPDKVSQSSGRNDREQKVQEKNILAEVKDQNQISQDVEEKISQDENLIKETADNIGKYLQKYNIGLKFGVDEESGKHYFQLVDQNENKVIKQIPSEEIIALSRKLSEMQGAIVNEVV